MKREGRAIPPKVLHHLCELIRMLVARWGTASALVGFAREMNTELIAEGVETAGEALALDALGIRLMQATTWLGPIRSPTCSTC